MAAKESIFSKDMQHPLSLLVLDGAKDLGEKVNQHLVSWYKRDTGDEVETFMVGNKCPRFSTGDAKGIIFESVRGQDLYILVDVGNYSCKYRMFDGDNCMSPDDHYADLKRIISAVGGKANKITVIMPLLYGGRQHKRSFRESLDASMMLHELEYLGVTDIITFDAHDPRVQNAVPLMGFDNYMANYQILKALLKKFPDIKFDKNHFMIVSPDEGAMNRNIFYSSVLGLDLGMYYKRRDYTTVVNGRNPIVAHEYLGNSVMGMDIFVADDIIASGESTLSLATELKAAGANRIFLTATYGLFTVGIDAFQKAYDEGIIAGVVSTNLTYTRPELKNCEWYAEADLSKYIAYIIAACHQNKSTASIIDPIKRVEALLKKHNENQ